MSVHAAQLEAMKEHVEQFVRTLHAESVAVLEDRVATLEAELAKLSGGAKAAAGRATGRGKTAAPVDDVPVAEATDSGK